MQGHPIYPLEEQPIELYMNSSFSSSEVLAPHNFGRAIALQQPDESPIDLQKKIYAERCRVFAMESKQQDTDIFASIQLNLTSGSPIQSPSSSLGSVVHQGEVLFEPLDDVSSPEDVIVSVKEIMWQGFQLELELCSIHCFISSAEQIIKDDSKKNEKCSVLEVLQSCCRKYDQHVQELVAVIARAKRYLPLLEKMNTTLYGVPSITAKIETLAFHSAYRNWRPADAIHGIIRQERWHGLEMDTAHGEKKSENTSQWVSLKDYRAKISEKFLSDESNSEVERLTPARKKVSAVVSFLPTKQMPRGYSTSEFPFFKHLAELYIRSDLALRNVYIDDDAGNYKSCLKKFPYLKDKNYPDSQRIQDEIFLFKEQKLLETSRSGQETMYPMFSTDADAKQKKKNLPLHCDDAIRSTSKPVIDLSDISKPFANATTLKPRYIVIGNWVADASDEVEILAKFHHSKKRLIWQYTDIRNKTSNKLSMNYGDVSKITVHKVYSGSENSSAFVALNLFLNEEPKLFQGSFNDKHKHFKAWVRAEDDFTFGSAKETPQMHTLIFEEWAFLRRRKKISQLERLILGDPYFASITKIDTDIPGIGCGFYILGRRSLEQLRDKLVSFFDTIQNYIKLYSVVYLSLCLNLQVSHTFKYADRSRTNMRVHEPAIAVNFDGIHAVASSRGDEIMSREEIQYYMQVTKIGENGICSFKFYHVSNNNDGPLHLLQGLSLYGQKDKAGDPLARKNDPNRAKACGFDAAQYAEQGDDSEYMYHASDVASMQMPEDVAKDDMVVDCGASYQNVREGTQVTGTRAEYSDARRTNAQSVKKNRGRPIKRVGLGSLQVRPKNVRVAMIFSKERLVIVCGEGIKSLWEDAEVSLQDYEPNRLL